MYPFVCKRAYTSQRSDDAGARRRSMHQLTSAFAAQQNDVIARVGARGQR